MVLLKADTMGNQQWVKYFGSTGLNAGYSVIQTSDGGFAIGGYWYIPGSSEYTGDPIVIKTDSMGCDTPGCAIGTGIYSPRPAHALQNSGLYIYPNPAISEIQVRFSILDSRSSIFIYDLYGRKLDEIDIPPGQEQWRLDISGYPAGLYVAVMKDEKGVVARAKFIKSGDR